MNAKKCDRCGSFYDVSNDKHTFRILERDEYAEHIVDLCKPCYINFVTWLTAYKTTQKKEKINNA